MYHLPGVSTHSFYCWWPTISHTNKNESFHKHTYIFWIVIKIWWSTSSSQLGTSMIQQQQNSDKNRKKLDLIAFMDSSGSMILWQYFNSTALDICRKRFTKMKPVHYYKFKWELFVKFNIFQLDDFLLLLKLSLQNSLFFFVVSVSFYFLG